MNLPASITISSDVMTRQVGDEIVLLDLAGGNYFGLNPVGARIWQLLGEGKATGEVPDILAAEFDVGRDQAEEDTRKLLLDLQAQGLIHQA